MPSIEPSGSWISAVPVPSVVRVQESVVASPIVPATLPVTITDSNDLVILGFSFIDESEAAAHGQTLAGPGYLEDVLNATTGEVIDRVSNWDEWAPITADRIDLISHTVGGGRVYIHGREIGPTARKLPAVPLFDGKGFNRRARAGIDDPDAVSVGPAERQAGRG